MEFWKIILLFGSALLGGLLATSSRGRAMPLKLVLSFSGAYLFAITILHLLPELYEHRGAEVGVYILLGFVLQVVLEHFSQGIEHGHIHHHHGKVDGKIPVVVVLSLCLHAFLEGMPISDHFSNKLVWGIALHHIPAAFALAMVIHSNGVQNKRLVAFILMFATMSPLGYLTGFFIKDKAGINTGLGFDIVMSVVIGMFLHISTTILFESSVDHKFNIKKLVAIMVGMSLALLNFLFDAATHLHH